MKAMIFAAGLGTRLKEETLYKPKALVEVGGKPLLQHAIEKLKKERFSEVVVNVHHFSDLVIEFVKNHDFGIPVHISDETGKLLDTGGGLKKATPLLAGNQPVLIYNVDILSNIDLQILVQEYLRSGALAMLVVRKRQTQRYFKFNGEKRLVGWINKKTDEKKIAIPEKFGKATEMAFSGIHIVGPEIFQLLPAKEKFSITDFYLDLAKDHLIKGYFDASEIWMDVGKPHELEEARKWFKSH
jgi:NDP-sugar pyrophosphorylase family protein